MLGDELLGTQTPRLTSCPPFFTTLGDDAVDLAAHAGLELDPWQQLVLRESLGERRGGRWACMECGLIVPRQNGKGAVIEARQLAAMFLTRDELIIYSAHRFKTAKAMFKRIRKLCEQTPELEELIRGRYKQSNDETSITLDWGALQFFARSGGSARGFTGNTMFFDEAYDLDPELIADMLPTLSAVRNPQVWYVSSAGMEASEVLAGIRVRGIKGEARLGYWEWSAPEGCDLDAFESLVVSNPGLGIRVDPEFVLHVERPGMDDERYGRERLGLWSQAKSTAVFDMARWLDCRDPASQVLDPVGVAVDVATEREFASVAVGGRRADGLHHGEVVAHERGTDWVVPAVAKLVALWDVAEVVVSANGPAGALIPDLEAAGIEVHAASVMDEAKASTSLFDKVRDRQFRHLGEPRLDAAAEAAGKRFVGDTWTLARRKSGGDISPVLSVALALFGATRAAGERKSKRSGKVW